MFWTGSGSGNIPVISRLGGENKSPSSILNVAFIDRRAHLRGASLHDIGKLILELFRSQRIRDYVQSVSREKNAPLFRVESAAMGN